jgi:uncharacterized protein (DUF983 family)
MSEHTDVDLKTASLRALKGCCPACGEAFGQIRADDAAPWATIILVGHVFLPFAFMVDVDFLPMWVVVTMWSALFAALSLAVLPRAKALFIAILWQTRAPGYQPVELV